ncbi:MAG: threonine-phosphate decarboxylase CobD [Beijerinckiaceae bacterium]|nr:threonine-phosphate decarboxylase CobD [Beijerinckiaceae bacterium]
MSARVTVSAKSMDEAPSPEPRELLLAEHGGDLSAARFAYPQAPEPWFDLSVCTNPYPYPSGGLSAECLAKLPDPEALRALEAAAATAYCVPAHAEVVAAPGTQAIINWLPRLIPAGRAGVLGFTYCEHERSWVAGGAKVSVVDEFARLEDQDIAVIVNPNNPDGRLFPAKDIHALAAALSKRGGLLIVDEAFADFLEFGASAVPQMPARGLIVLRSFGKTYGLPGLRLGFAIAPIEAAAKLRTALGPWPVSGAAIEIGTKALKDSEWLAWAWRKLKVDAAWLDAILAAAGLERIGGTELFRLVRHPDAGLWHARLAETGILTRQFLNHPDWLRFGIVSSVAGRERLRAALGLGFER